MATDLEMDELKARIEMLEAANQQLREEAEQKKIGVFNINDHETRAAIMNQLAITSPTMDKVGLIDSKPQLLVMHDEKGGVVGTSINVPGYSELTPDQAEAVAFALYEKAATARKHLTSV